MNIPPFFIRILGDLIPKEQREQLITDIARTSQAAHDTVLLCKSMNEQIQRMNEKLNIIQGVAVDPDQLDQNSEPETIPFDELETVEIIEPDFSEHPKADTEE